MPKEQLTEQELDDAYEACRKDCEAQWDESPEWGDFACGDSRTVEKFTAMMESRHKYHTVMDEPMKFQETIHERAIVQDELFNETMRKLSAFYFAARQEAIDRLFQDNWRGNDDE